MKGKATCPKCKHKFVVDLPKSEEKKLVVCPNCNHNFNVRFKEESGGCSWEEHGEPRKTVLSAIRPKTNKPMIAVILLVCVFSIGITTAVFSEAFVETTMDAASFIGFSSDVEFNIIDSNNNTINNATVTVDDVVINQNDDGIYNKGDIKPGIHDVEITKEGFKSKNSEILVLPLITYESTFTLNNGTGSVEKTEFNSLVCSSILGIFSVFALLSVIVCLKREYFDIAVAGAALAIFSFGFFFVGSIISIIALIFILKSRDEFKNGTKGKIF